MSQELSLEDRLKDLVTAYQPDKRNKWALEWKREGKKVMGTTCTYIPDEIIYAAGMLPFRLWGTGVSETPRASYWRADHLCPYCNHVLEALLGGEFDFLDGMILTDWDDDSRRLWDVVDYIHKPEFTYLLHVPHQDSESAYKFFANSERSSLGELKGELEKIAGNRITEEALLQAIEVYNKTRQLIKGIYELRKKEVPPLSGEEALGLTLAATIMPREEYNKELEQIAEYLQKREAPIKSLRPRLLVASDILDNPAYLELIEGVGSLIVMDDLDTGSRYMWSMVGDKGDPYFELAKGYISRPADPRMFFWDKQVEQVIDWVKEWGVDGVIHLPLNHSLNRLWCAPYFEARLKEAGIPVMTIVREYYLGKVGALRTRVEGFKEVVEETIGGKK